MDFESQLLEESPDAVIAISEEGRILYWSRGAESIFGYTSGEAIGHALHELVVPPDRKDEEARILRETLDGGQATYESIRRAKSGSLVYVDITSRAVRKGDGTPGFVVSTKKDVTHLKVMRDARLVEARFGRLLDSTPDAIVMVNPTGRIVLANANAEALFGYRPGGLLARPIEALLPERYRHAHIGHRSAYFSQPRVRAMGAGLELHGLRQDGSEFPVEISLSPLTVEEGGTLVMSAIRDISERKRVERALQEKNLELAQANEAKDRFLAAMSHELRTPLNAIIGFTGTLLMKLPGPLNADQEKQLQTVRASANHLLALINDLLDLAKIEAGKIELKREPTRCRGLIEAAVTSLRQFAESKGLDLRLEADDDDIEVQVDRRAFSQIILNLFNNAIKFTERGSVRISVARVAHDGRRSVAISVADTGIGIRAQDRDRLFTAFSRVDVTQRNPQEGTGLGLHLSRSLAQAMGGTIELRSEFGQGSTFTLLLPER
jgi:PAS domain S-box-containing protein